MPASTSKLAEEQGLAWRDAPARKGTTGSTSHHGVAIALEPLIDGAGAAGNERGSEKRRGQGHDRERAGFPAQSEKETGRHGREHQDNQSRLGQREVSCGAACDRREESLGRRRGQTELFDRCHRFQATAPRSSATGSAS